jgi:flavin-dependent thymidylate synthase
VNIKFLEVTTPSSVAVSAARTCYFPNGLVEPSRSDNWARKDDLLQAIFKAGHHTTLQHTHITMMISGMSRHLIWRLLHSHPYYNSEQVSQRYAKMQGDGFVYPKGADEEVWENFYQDRFNDYENLIDILTPDIAEVTPKFRQKDVGKKAQEMARYLLPVGTSAYLYHTVNVITLLRYISVAKAVPEARNEAMEFAEKIAKMLIEMDASLQPLVNHAQKLEVSFPTLNFSSYQTDDEVKVFDIVDHSSELYSEHYADVLRTSQMLLDEGVLGSFNTTMQLSLSADAQNQRHRRSPAIRPKLEDIYQRNYYIPPIIAQNSEALKIYNHAIEASYDFFEAQKEEIGFGEAVYALLNAHKIALVEHNDMTSFAHKAQMRLCYNAQQEIYDITYEQVRQLRAHGVQQAEKFLPPCAIRNALKIRPICPEGDHFCGVKVWKLPFDEYERKI